MTYEAGVHSVLYFHRRARAWALFPFPLFLFDHLEMALLSCSVLRASTLSSLPLVKPCNAHNPFGGLLGSLHLDIEINKSVFDLFLLFLSYIRCELRDG
jgi:hypothetical protein